MATITMHRVLDRVREVARDVAAPLATTIDTEARWPEESISALLEQRLGGLVLDESSGGMGHGLATLARACEELGKACASTAICFGMHSVGSAVLAARATPDQRERFLAPIVQGKHLTTLALSEPGSGSHFYIPATKLEPGGDGYVVDGTKSFVTNAGHADSLVVSVASAGAPGDAGSFSCAVIPGDGPGVVRGAVWAGVGMRGNDARTVELRGVSIPRANLLGEEGDEIWYVFNVIAPYFLAAMAGTYLGVASAALDEVIEHLNSRRHVHSGNVLANSAVLQHRVGTLWAQVERTRRLLYFAVDDAERGEELHLPPLLSIKAEVAECAVAVANEAMTLTGGIGYREHSSTERRLRDARAAHVMAPTTDLLRTWVGRDLLGLPLLTD